MTRTTGIEWTEHTWNPFVGCSVHTDGCTNCYAMKTAHRLQSFGTIKHYDGVVTKSKAGKPVWTGKVSRGSDRAMSKPDRIPGRSTIFVNSMSDFFHESANDAWRVEALDVMRRNGRHQFQILTKRPESIAPFIERCSESFPPNVWLGVTVENGKHVHRIDTLRRVSAKVKFISFEPLIGSVGTPDLSGIDWAISGGESGPIRRRCNAEWAREIRDNCARDGVSFFHKQWGHWSDNPIAHGYGGPRGAAYVQALDPEGKGGSLLDGIYHKEFPAV